MAPQTIAPRLADALQLVAWPLSPSGGRGSGVPGTERTLHLQPQEAGTLCWESELGKSTAQQQRVNGQTRGTHE